MKTTDELLKRRLFSCTCGMPDHAIIVDEIDGEYYAWAVVNMNDSSLWERLKVLWHLFSTNLPTIVDSIVTEIVLPEEEAEELCQMLDQAHQPQEEHVHLALLEDRELGLCYVHPCVWVRRPLSWKHIKRILCGGIHIMQARRASALSSAMVYALNKNMPYHTNNPNQP